MIHKILLAMCVVFALTNTALSIFLLSRSFAAQEQRATTQSTIKNFECILLIQPADRTVDNVRDCKTNER